MKKYKNQAKLILITIFLFFSTFIFAKEIKNPIEHETIESLINAIFSFVQVLIISITAILFLYAGIKYHQAQGSPEKAKEATNIIKYTIIGVVVILIARGSASIIKSIMGI